LASGLDPAQRLAQLGATRADKGGGRTMNNKLYIRLAPLLAVAAFAVMPAATQASCTAPACPHVYKNATLGAEGKKLREIWWGTLKLHNTTFGEIECHTILGTFEENPVGGGAAKGQVQGFYPYECADTTCTTALGGKAIHVVPGKLPWLTEVFENAQKEFREKIGHKGPSKNIRPNELTEPGFVDFTVNCEGVATGEVFGELDALILNNGISVGSSPGELQFESEKANPESSNLETETLLAFEVEGRVKREGYGAEELVEVKNP
jgi:hypothetical protein